MRPSGVAALMRSTTPGVAASQASIISVAVPPGVMPFTRMANIVSAGTERHGGLAQPREAKDGPRLLQRVVRSFLLRVEAGRAGPVVPRHERAKRVLAASTMVCEVKVSNRSQR